MKRRDWSYGYRGVKETRSVLITEHVARHFGTPMGKVIKFKGPPVRTAEDMTPEELVALEAEYGCRVSGRFQWRLT